MAGLFLFPGALAQPINLKGSTFTPSESTPGLMPNIFTLGSEKPQGYQLIQFRSSTSEEYRDNLKNKGVDFISYIPENTWVVKVDAERDEIVSEERVKYLGDYKSEYRVHPVLRDNDKSGQVNVNIEVFRKSPNTLNKLDSYGVTQRIGGKSYRIQTTYSQISNIASENIVKWVYPERPEPQKTNDQSRELIDVERLQNAPEYLKGSGFTAAIWDAGWAGQHADLNQTLGWTGNPKTLRNDTGSSVDDHGTHVAGTMLGNGTLDNNYRGMAPKSRLITYEWPGGADYGYSYETEIFNETGFASNSFNSVVSQNSWGYAIDDTNDYLMGDYGSVTAAYDNITANYSDINPLSIVFSAGNEADENYDYSSDYNRTTGPGATAKNTISVGAVDGNLDIAYFSSWGPTDDGRIKPTVVADGRWVRSTEPGNNYGNKGGTSMAAPAVSGAVILLNQQYNRTFSDLPSPATAKGLLVHNAEDLNRTGPDYITGWGLVNASESVDYVKESEWKDLIKRDSVSTGEYNNYTLQVSESADNINFTLVWSDYPSEGSASKHLINDLDLEVRNSTGHRYYPWTLNWTTRKSQAVRNKQDRRNNVVEVTISDPKDDTYKVSVKGHGVPQGPQKYSLLMTDQKKVYPSITVKSPENKSYKNSPDFNITTDIPLQEAKFSVDGGSNISMANITDQEFYNISTSSTEGSHQVRFWAHSTEGYWSSKTETFTVDRTKPALEIRKPSEGTNTSGKVDINATSSDSISGVESTIYNIRNNTGIVGTGDLNATVDTEDLKDGEYDLIFNVTDKAGNYRSKSINVTVDNTAPSINSANPQDNSVLAGNFGVNATWSDNEGVKNHTYALKNQTGTQISRSLNDTVNSNNLEGGEYNLTFEVSDYAGNTLFENRSVTLDNSKPEINILKPDTDGYAAKVFDVNATVNGTFSSIVEANYSLSNQTATYRTGDLNGTVDASGLEEGKYNLTLEALDQAGNYNSTRIEITMDFQKPSLNLLTPKDSEIINGTEYINATYSDAGSGVKNAFYQINKSSTNYASGDLNTSLDTSTVSDETYQLFAEVVDKAGNVNNTTNQITIDNTAPQIVSSNIKSNENFQGFIDVNATLFESSNVEKAIFRWRNSSGNVTPWQDFNLTGFDTTKLETGIYDLEYEFNDTTGNTNAGTLTGKTLDNTSPDLTLEKYSQSDNFAGWFKDSRKIEASCQDEGSGFQNIKLFLGSEIASTTSSPHNFTVTQTGNNTYDIRCNDKVGLQTEKQVYTAIDTKSPEYSSASPSNNSETDRSLTLTVNFQDESNESGLNETASTISSSNADLSNINWDNSSVTADISGLDYSESYSIQADFVDNLEHSDKVYLTYTTINDPDSGDGSDDDSSDGSQDDSSTGDSGGGFTPPPQPEPTIEERFIDLNPGLRAEYLKLTAGEIRNIDITEYSENSISELNVDASKSGRTNITVEETDVASSEETVLIERSFDLDVTNRSGVSSIEAVFGVQKSWVESYDFTENDISIYRSEGELSETDTQLKNETDDRYYFTAQLDQDTSYSISAQRACTSSEVSAVDPDTGVCRKYSSGCSKPDGWNTVESCSIYDLEQEAKEQLERIQQAEASQEKVSSVQSKIERGNYSGAIEVAQTVEKTEQNDDSPPLIPIIFGLVFLVVASGGGYVGYQNYSGRKEIEDLGSDIDSFGQKIMQKVHEDNSKTYEESTNLIIQAKDAYENEEYERARDLLRKSRIKFKSEDSPANRLYGDK